MGRRSHALVEQLAPPGAGGAHGGANGSAAQQDSVLLVKTSFSALWHGIRQGLRNQSLWAGRGRTSVPYGVTLSARWLSCAHISAQRGGANRRARNSRSDCPPFCANQQPRCGHEPRIREQSSLPQVFSQTCIEGGTQLQTASPASGLLQGYSASSVQMPARSCRSELARDAFPAISMCSHRSPLAGEGAGVRMKGLALRNK